MSPVFEGLTSFLCEHTGMALAVFGDSNKEGAPIVQAPFNNQGFIIDIIDIPGGDPLSLSPALVRLRHPGGNKVITVWDASQLNFAPTILSEWRHLDNQQFFAQDIGDNLFRLSAKHSNQRLAVFGASFSPGAPIVQFKVGGLDATETWRLERIERG